MGAPRVDWKASYAYSGMSWENILELKPEIPLEVRARFLPGNYYNYQFSDDRVWQCFSVFHPKLESPMYVYLKRDNPQFEEIMSLFRRKKDLAFTIRMAYPEGKKQVNQAELIEMLGDTWFDLKR